MKKGGYINTIEKALMHGLFVHLHHNIDKVIDFKGFQVPGMKGYVVAKMDSHCSPCVPRPYDAAATGAGGAMRDVVAMGGRPVFLLDFIGTRPLEQEVIVGPCGFSGHCTCGKCKVMTSGERVNIMVKGLRDMCEAMDVFIVGGGFSTSFSDIVPAVVVSVFGKLVTERPLTKRAKKAGDKIIIIGVTGNDGNDTLYRAGLVKEMRPAIALFKEERTALEAAMAAFGSGKIKACSDLGAAGIGAAICESARYMVHVAPESADEVLRAVRSKTDNAVVIGEVTSDEKEVFEYNGEVVAVIPNKPSKETLEALRSGK